ncbi:hypothetical protein HDU93_007092 [Gonapodya sp. JEL0774]|nr:hypothetical protein HDU93_007092 [Gonapodya sp. JEL0774]
MAFHGPGIARKETIALASDTTIKSIRREANSPSNPRGLGGLGGGALREVDCVTAEDEEDDGRNGEVEARDGKDKGARSRSENVEAEAEDVDGDAVATLAVDMYEDTGREEGDEEEEETGRYGIAGVDKEGLGTVWDIRDEDPVTVIEDEEEGVGDGVAVERDRERSAGKAEDREGREVEGSEGEEEEVEELIRAEELISSDCAFVPGPCSTLYLHTSNCGRMAWTGRNLGQIHTHPTDPTTLLPDKDVDEEDDAASHSRSARSSASRAEAMRSGTVVENVEDVETEAVPAVHR